MSTQFAFRTVAVVAVLAFLTGCLAALAQAQEPVPAPARTLVAAGSGQADVTPKNAKDNASIVAAIDAAQAKALPRALAEAKEEAQDLATAAGVTLGPLVTISNVGTQGVFFGPYPFYGTFGPNRYCGTIRQPVFRTGQDGKRHRVGSRARHVCRFPRTLQRQVQLTYALL